MKKDIRQRIHEENVSILQVDRYKRSDQMLDGHVMDVQAIHTTGLLPEKEIFTSGLNRLFAQVFFLIHP